MFTDVNSGIESESNYLVALGLMTCTEFLGGLITGKLGISGCSKQNFNKALSMMYFVKDKNYYRNFKVTIISNNNRYNKGIYELVRCGLSHEYFIKGPKSGVANDSTGKVEIIPDEIAEPRYPGVWYDTKRRNIMLYTNFYFKDLKQAYNRYKYRLLIRKNKISLSNFFKSINRLNTRKFIKVRGYNYWDKALIKS